MNARLSRAFVVFFTVLLTAPLLSGQEILERGEPRVYSGEHLEAVGMPVGGIGTGNIWIAGDGGLSVWQIFNTLTEKARLPDSFFAVRACTEGGEPVLYALEEGGRPGFRPAAVKTFRGDYPFAWLEFERGDLPVEVSLEAFNPMIPLDLKDSSIPCAIFTLTARNPGERPVDVSFAAMLQNAAGYDGLSKIERRRFAGFGGNRNTLERGEGFVRFRLDVPDRSRPRLAEPLSVLYSGRPRRALATCENLKVERLPADGSAPDTDAVWGSVDPLVDPRFVEAVARMADGGGIAVVEEWQEFLQLILEIREAAKSDGWGGGYVLFEDFESGSHDGWTVEGKAFGEKPHSGTSPSQNPVSGFLGKGLVNSYIPDDGPQGVMTSGSFIIEKRYIGFLVGGGAHSGKTCINLKVGGDVVRTTTGRNSERLEPARWDVADLEGKEAVLEIVDRASSGWGHVNVDQIVFSDLEPRGILGKEDALRAIAMGLPAELEGKKPIAEKGDLVPRGFTLPFGKGRLVLVADGPGSDLDWLKAIAAAHGVGFEPGAGLPESAPAFGDMCLSVFDGNATACAAWTASSTLAADLGDDGVLSGPEDADPSPAGETLNCALAVPFTLQPGESRSVPFVISWCFPNLERYGHEGNYYAELFPAAAAADEYVRAEFDRLRDTTRLFHDTLYETNLPYWMIDCLSSQSCIFRTINCFFAARHAGTGKPYFAGYEGCYGCCPLNCTHVWNYAQTHARLYPEIGRNLRWYDFNHYLRLDGETQHRQHRPHGAFIDGHCAVIEGAYREHLLSPDDAFLREIWPGVRKAVVWLIAKVDADEDGVNAGQQWNTYDVATDGAHTFLGSQYLSALAAAEKMARVMGDGEFAARCARIVASGSRNQDALLWNGEYYIQIPDEKPARDYNIGCHSDQLLGQWWSHMLDNGYLYPRGHVRTALESIYRYNLLEDVTGFQQRPRRYVIDGEGGLLMCTWPRGGRPDPFILYADEVWTGIEYSTAGLMIYEGMLEEAFTIVKTARDRYDGRLREGLNSGPGGNPFCELECGRFYARALSSWSLLLAAQGFICDAPAGRIGFVPRWRPEDHRSFFSAAEGWGLFRQQARGNSQAASIDVRFGRLPVRELVLGRPENAGDDPRIAVALRGGPVAVEEARVEAERLVIVFGDEIVVNEGESLQAAVEW